MPKRISDVKKQLIYKLHNDNLTISEISKRVGVAYSTVRTYVIIKRYGLGNISDYLKSLLKEKDFDSIYGYHRYLAEKNGFESVSEYNKHLAKKLGFESRQKYQIHLLKKRGFESAHEYKKYLAKKLGFESPYKYEMYNAENRQKKSENKKLSELIKNGLIDLKENQKWLVEQVGASRSSISAYSTGKTIPNEATLGKIFLALRVPYKTIDDLLR